MHANPFLAPAALTVRVRADLATVPNLLLSLWALTADAVAADPWTAQAAALAPEQRAFNQLLFATCGDLLLAVALESDPAAGFPGYLAALAAQPASAFAARLTALDPAAAGDPAAQHDQALDHLRTLWTTLLAPEWQRHTHQLTKMTRAVNELIFSQPQWLAADPFHALRFLLQTEPADEQLALLAGVEEIVLVWSPHLTAHCTRLASPGTLWVVRRFDPQLLRRDPLRRAEVLGPLTALADATRLHILELLVAQGELRAQEIIAQLEGSQGNVSRHLKQLAGAGLVRERRAGDANKLYTYDPAGLGRLLHLTRQLLSPANAAAAGQETAAARQLSQTRAAAPPLVQELLDDQGRVTRWPGKLKEQDALLHFLIAKFEQARSYTEREVNELLQAWYLDADYVLVRRSLIDAGLLARTRDGARYWRAL